MADYTLIKHTFDLIDVTGYSVAGEETVVSVPSLDVCFDIGRAPDSVIPINHILLSHGHMDHAAGIAYYFSQRDFRQMRPGTVLLPESLVQPVDHLLDCWGRIDGNRPSANIIAMTPGIEYEIRRNLFVYPFQTNHSYGSLGYCIIERRHKLKKEYLDMPGTEIAKLRKSGRQVTYTINMPLVTYIGDTAGGDFENLECVSQSKIIIIECTFFDPDHHDRARAGKHYHIDYLAKLLPKWNNEHIVLTHLSRRTDLRSARKTIDKVFAPDLAKRIRFLMERQPAR